MNHEDKLLHLYTEQMMGIASVTPVGVVQGTDQMIPHRAELEEIQAQSQDTPAEETRELQIAKLMMKDLKALDAISRKSQCRTLIGRIDYRIDKLKTLAKELIQLHSHEVENQSGVQ